MRTHNFLNSDHMQRIISYYMDHLLTSYSDMCEYARDNGLSVPDFTEETLLNGSSSWEEYSYGGLALISNWDLHNLFYPVDLYGVATIDEVEALSTKLLDMQGVALGAAWEAINTLYSELYTSSH